MEEDRLPKMTYEFALNEERRRPSHKWSMQLMDNHGLNGGDWRNRDLQTPENREVSSSSIVCRLSFIDLLKQISFHEKNIYNKYKKIVKNETSKHNLISSWLKIKISNFPWFIICYFDCLCQDIREAQTLFDQLFVEKSILKKCLIWCYFWQYLCDDIVKPIKEQIK